MASKQTINEYLAEFGDTSGDRPYAHGRILYIIHELSRLVATNFDQYMARHKLTHSQWWAIMHIGENPGASQTDIANIMQMTRGAAGKLLERLEAKNWIERRADPQDSRVRRIYLADGVLPVFRLMGSEGMILFENMLGNLPPTSETVLLETLRQIKANAQAGLAAGANRSAP